MKPSNGGSANEAGSVRVLIAVTDQGERRGLCLLLGSQPDVEVVGEAGEKRRAVALATAMKPHAMVVDLLLPGLECLRFLDQVNRHSPRTRVVILSMPPGAAEVTEGSVAFRLIRAVRACASNERVASVPLPVAVIEAAGPGANGPRQGGSERLTPREQDVVMLATRGLSSTETGRQLGISPRTVETHRAHAMRKLGLHCRAELVRYAIMRGFLPTL